MGPGPRRVIHTPPVSSAARLAKARGAASAREGPGARAGRFHGVRGLFWLRFTYVAPVLVTKLRMETPGPRPRRCASSAAGARGWRGSVRRRRGASARRGRRSSTPRCRRSCRYAAHGREWLRAQPMTDGCLPLCSRARARAAAGGGADGEWRGGVFEAPCLPAISRPAALSAATAPQSFARSVRVVLGRAGGAAPHHGGRAGDP
eukprot:COSAG01_NODE_1935_length_8863_cov_22.221563_8_plen_205_part_00